MRTYYTYKTYIINMKKLNPRHAIIEGEFLIEGNTCRQLDLNWDIRLSQCFKRLSQVNA